MIPSQGESHHQSTISNATISTLFKRRYECGDRVMDIADDLGITANMATEFLGARKRKHQTRPLKEQYAD